MVTDIRCKRIIGGTTYNTETATPLGSHNDEDEPWEEILFKTRYGAYFIYVYSHIDLKEKIIPASVEDAKKWLEEKGSTDQYEAEFGEAPEAGDPEARITLRLPETLRSRIAKLAEERDQSLNAWIVRCVERCAESEAKQPTASPTLIHPRSRRPT